MLLGLLMALVSWSMDYVSAKSLQGRFNLVLYPQPLFAQRFLEFLEFLPGISWACLGEGARCTEEVWPRRRPDPDPDALLPLQLLPYNLWVPL